MLGALSAWVEQGKAPGTLLALDQEVAIPFAPKRALPLCEWPASPRYKAGDVKAAGSFECSK
jgi:feruloyl esterase